ncbi:MAG: hypothetical protein RLZZ437_3353 [Pseudomonadota bacterium]|jgi:hypothetical protein
MTIRSASIGLLGLFLPSLAFAAEGERITVTGEFIDTWCYFSGVMGSTDAVVGSAHHTCAVWCSAGGVPVGLLAEDGTVYMVLKIEGADANNGGDTQLMLASDTITADGLVYQRDGLNYIVVEKIVDNAGITNLTHESYGAIPPFAIPEAN